MTQEKTKIGNKLTDSPIFFTENDHFWGEIESRFQHVGGKNKKADVATFFLVGHNSSS